MGTLNKHVVLTCVALAVALLSCQPATAGLIDNGDFELGVSDFATDYLLNHVDLFSPKTYDVVKDASVRHSAFSDIGDHTSGAGLMFVANGALDETRVWEQEVTVTPGTTYDFSMWATSLYFNSPATLQIEFNGVSASSNMALTSDIVWRQYTTTWSSGANSSVTILIRDLNPAGDGNDFALDDISLDISSVPEPASFVLLGLGGIGLALHACRRRRPTALVA